MVTSMAKSSEGPGSLLTRQLVEEAVILAETIAAVEAAKEKESPEEVLQ